MRGAFSYKERKEGERKVKSLDFFRRIRLRAHHHHLLTLYTFGPFTFDFLTSDPFVLLLISKLFLHFGPFFIVVTNLLTIGTFYLLRTLWSIHFWSFSFYFLTTNS